MSEDKKETIKRLIALVVFICIILVVAFVVLKYQVDGDKNIPFKVSKITVISTAEPSYEKNEENALDVIVNQCNDVYFYIEKNENINKQSVIESVVIRNIKILNNPNIGTVKTYMPNCKEGEKYLFSEDLEVKDSLTYNGALASNERNLEIGNQGGKVLIRFANTNLGRYKTENGVEIPRDGRLLNNVNVNQEDTTFVVSFDIIITIDSIAYKANVKLTLPYGNLVEEKIVETNITDSSEFVFKRI